MTRLALATLADVPAACRPVVDPRGFGVGIVHLGLGAFHRAHQAAFTDDALAAAGGDWGICGVSQRSRAVLDTLAPQDGLFSVLIRDGDDVRARVGASVRELLFAGDDPDAVPARIADPAVRVVTLTVTEKAYRPDGAVVRQLVDGLRRRHAAGAGPIAVLSCDNLAGNGATLARLVRTAADDPLDDVAFPSSMVDRIVPAPTDADRADARRRLGLRDDAAVATDPFRQWVIEDDFPAGRPAWDAAGALLTDDVAPYETIKLRMLNAAHSTLAYLGALGGCATVADAITQDGLARLVDALWRDDVVPTLTVPDGFDLAAYEQQVRARFANPALRHSLTQVATDGSQKLPHRLVAIVRDARAAGRRPTAATFALAGWLRWVSTDRTDDGVAHPLDDPLAGELRAAVGGAATPAAVVGGLLGVDAVFGPDLRADATVRAMLTDALARITADGALAAAGHALD